MRAVIQRVSSASVSVGTAVVGEINHGLLILLGIQNADTSTDVTWLAEKIAALRIFADADGKMNRSIVELGDARDPSRTHATALVVSQFTLLASTRKGTRPSFNDAEAPALAIPLYESFVAKLSTALGRPVATGQFGAAMQVALINDGPVTLMLDSRLRE
jgi:D-tyrosyl-tRNA(Tyr) deacylase